jgi:hypothetical protein
MRPALLAALLSTSLAQATPPPAPAPKAPMPTEAQCVALGSPGTPNPFGPGETLEYDVDALGA